MNPPETKKHMSQEAVQNRMNMICSKTMHLNRTKRGRIKDWICKVIQPGTSVRMVSFNHKGHSSPCIPLPILPKASSTIVLLRMGQVALRLLTTMQYL